MHGIWWLWIPLLLFLFFGPFRRRYWRGPWRDWDYRYAGGGRGRERESLEQRREREEREQKKNEQIEQLETRVAELESRLDFAERLLAQRRDAGGGGGQLESAVG